MTEYTINFNDGTKETVKADRYIGDQDYLKFFRDGPPPVVSVAKASDVMYVISGLEP